MLAVWSPLSPSSHDQGDPFVVRVPDGVAARHRYYVYTTGEGGRADGAFSVFASDTLQSFERLEHNALTANLKRAHWAPSVTYVEGLARPWVMLYSRGFGLGEEAHIGHQLRRADAERPEGPFADSGHVLSEAFDFAIDPDVFELDGRRMLAFAADYVADDPRGTGLFIAEIDHGLQRLLTKPEPLARPASDWQLFDPERSMPWKTIPGVDWSRGDKVRWYCIEGPSGGLRSPAGHPVLLYSGGCYFGKYTTAAMTYRGGRWEDSSGGGSHFVLEAHPDKQIYATGHVSHTTSPAGEVMVFFHARFGSPGAERQFAMARLIWSDPGTPRCEDP
jgi:GH43 family beta-xylosidase